MLYWLAFLVLVIAASLGAQTMSLLDQSEGFQQELSAEAVSIATASADRIRQLDGAYPASLTDIAAHPMGLALRGYIGENEGGTQPDARRVAVFMTTGSGIVDSSWTFSRVVVYGTFKTGRFEDTAAFLASEANQCRDTAGSATGQTPESAVSWCGEESRDWKRLELRNAALVEMGQERANQIRLMGKFVAALQGNGAFPTLGAPGSTQSLYSLASAPSSFSSCGRDIYTWNGIVLGCEDLYSRWGTPTIYHFRQDGDIAVLAETPFKDETGAPVYVATEMRL